MRYAELYATKNLQKESMLEYMSRVMGNEVLITSNDTIVISFDDGTNYDTRDYNDYEEDSVLNDASTEVNSYSRSCRTLSNSSSLTTISGSDYEPEYKEPKKKYIIIGNKIYPYEMLAHFLVDGYLFQLQLPTNYRYSFRETFAPYFKNKYGSFDTISSYIEGSIYNSIYTTVENRNYANPIRKFCIIKVKSSKLNPQYVIAYDDKYFSKKSVIYLADVIFKQLY